MVFGAPTKFLSTNILTLLLLHSSLKPSMKILYENYLFRANSANYKTLVLENFKLYSRTTTLRSRAEV